MHKQINCIEKKIITIFLSVFFVVFLFLSFVSSAQAGCCYAQNEQKFQVCKNAASATDCPQGGFSSSDDCADSVCDWCAPGKFCLQVPFPGSEQVESAVRENILLTYIRTVFQFAVWTAIFLGIFMIMVGGFLYLTSAGSPERAGRAKDYISNAVLGLLLALFSFLILQTINPRLVDLSIPKIQDVKTIGKGGDCCYNRGNEEVLSEIKTDMLLGEADTCTSAMTLAQYQDPRIKPEDWLRCPDISTCCVCATIIAPVTAKGGDNFDGEYECFVNVPPSFDCPATQVEETGSTRRIKRCAFLTREYCLDYNTCVSGRKIFKQNQNMRGE